MAGERNKTFGGLAASFMEAKQPFLFVARGRSMSPFVLDGETVEVRPLRRKARPGDVVLLRRNDGSLLVHRVVSYTDRGVITRGDACGMDDGPSGHEMIVGRVCVVQGRFRRFFFRFPFGYIITLLPDFRKFPHAFGLLKKIAKPLL